MNLIIFQKKRDKVWLNTRFDFLVQIENKKLYWSQNITLSEKALAEFPDTITTRGLKHINELLNEVKKIIRFLFFIWFKEMIVNHLILQNHRSNYAIALGKAVKNKLKILCYDCKFSQKE